MWKVSQGDPPAIRDTMHQGTGSLMKMRSEKSLYKKRDGHDNRLIPGPPKSVKEQNLKRRGSNARETRDLRERLFSQKNRTILKTHLRNLDCMSSFDAMD